MTLPSHHASAQPYERVVWDAPFEPTEDKIRGVFQRLGFQPPSLQEYPASQRSKEFRHHEESMLVLLTGKIQLAFPGYGVIDLQPGDQVTIHADAVYDVTTTATAASLLWAARA